MFRHDLLAVVVGHRNGVTIVLGASRLVGKDEWQIRPTGSLGFNESWARVRRSVPHVVRDLDLFSAAEQIDAVLELLNRQLDDA